MKTGIAELQIQLALEPENAELYYQLGMAWQEAYPGYTFHEDHGTHQSYDFKGVDELQQATKLDPMNFKYAYQYALFREQRCDWHIAIGLFKRCLELDPYADNIYEDIQRVEAKLKEQRERDKSYAQQNIDKKPKDVQSLRWMAISLSQDGNYEEALQWYQKALDAAPEDDDTYIMMAGCYFQAKRYEESIAAYKKAVELFVPSEPEPEDLQAPDYVPDNCANTHVRIGECYMELKDFDQAEAHFRKALELDPTCDYITVCLAAVEFARERYAEALPLYLKAVEEDNENRWPYIDEWIALCYFQLNDFERAKGWLERCIKNNRGYSGAYYNLAVVYDRLGDEEGVEMVLEMAVQANQQDVKALYHLARRYKQKGYYRDALELMEKAVRVNPFDPIVLEMKAEIYGHLGDSEKGEMDAMTARIIQDIKDGKEPDWGDDENEEGEEDEEEEEL